MIFLCRGPRTSYRRSLCLISNNPTPDETVQSPFRPTCALLCFKTTRKRSPQSRAHDGDAISRLAVHVLACGSSNSKPSEETFADCRSGVFCRPGARSDAQPTPAKHEGVLQDA